MTTETKLGELLMAGSTEKRDAVHVALNPVFSASKLYPGQGIGFPEDGNTELVGVVENPLGIVDPFLDRSIQPGQWFWMVMYPESVTGMRHAWEHPAFSKAEAAEDSYVWIKEFAEKCNVSVAALMDAAATYLRDDEYTLENSESYKEVWDEFPTFWKHYARLTGVDPPEDLTDVPFSCSC